MNLLPQPKQVIENKGICRLTYQTMITMHSSLPQNVNRYAGLIKEEIKKELGFTISATRSNLVPLQKGIQLVMSEQGGLAESYQLLIEQERIMIEGADEAGILYGVHSLRQMIRQYGAFLPCVQIIDAPSISNRGFSHDVTRGRIPTLEQLKKLADTCSFYKMNQLQLYVEHSYLFEKESEVWRGNTPLCAEEIMELDAYCRSLHIDLVPTLASFGHLYELLRTKTYSHLCELEVKETDGFSLVDRMRHHTVDVTQEESLHVLQNRIREYMSLFSSRYFNICADETFDLGKGKSKGLADQEGVHKIYVDFLKKLCDYVISCGKTPMYWGDIIVEQPEIIRELPENSICLNWEYAPCVKEDNLRKLSQAGAKNIYVCPGVQGWDHLINRHANAYQNIYKMCQNGHKYQVQGVLNTDWGDLGHIAHAEFSTIGLIYGAAFSWSDEAMSEEECNRRISLLQYGDKTEKLVSLFRELSEQECLSWWRLVNHKETTQAQKEVPDLGKLFADESVASVEERIGKIEEVVSSLYGFLPAAGSRAKQDINAYILMAEGQKLLGRLVRIVLRNKQDGCQQKADDPTALAVDLEYWLMRYQELWRSSAKESELCRIVEIIVWVADYLRTYC